MKNYNIWLKADYFDIIAFYPYTSIVHMRLLEQNHNYKTEEHDFIQSFADEIWVKAEELGCKRDNKIVVEIKSKVLKDCFNINSSLFVGWHDGQISIGLSMYQPDSWTKENNINFKNK